MRLAFPLLSLVALACASRAAADGFTLESASFGPNATLDAKYVFDGSSCRGSNDSPELHWSGAPEDTKSFAVTLFDPDARNGAGFWHWMVFDLSAKTTSLPVGAGSGVGSTAPPGSVSGTNDFGRIGYSGPCPPEGDKPHRYVFTVYALRTGHLGVPAGADGAAVRKALEADTLLSATLQAQYGR